jgi:hypothetical protein
MVKKIVNELFQLLLQSWHLTTFYIILDVNLYILLNKIHDYADKIFLTPHPSLKYVYMYNHFLSISTIKD